MPESETASCHLTFDVLVNRVDFLLDVDIVLGKRSNPAKILDSLLALTLGHEPSWRFAEPESADQKKSGGDKLDSEWNDP